MLILDESILFLDFIKIVLVFESHNRYVIFMLNSNLLFISMLNLYTRITFSDISIH